MMEKDKEPDNDPKNNTLSLHLLKASTIVKKETCIRIVEDTSSCHPTESPIETSSVNQSNSNVKVEVLDDASFLEDEGGVGTRCSDTTACTKQELDIGPTELQPPDMFFMLQSCKPDPDYDEPLKNDDVCYRVNEDGSHQLLVLKQEGFTQQSNNDQFMHNSPESLQQGPCWPMSLHDTQRLETVPQPAHTDSIMQINSDVIELLVGAPEIPEQIAPQDAPLRDHVNFPKSKLQEDNVYFQTITEHSQLEISKNNSGKRFECDYCHKIFYKKDKLSHHIIVHSPVKRHKCKYCSKRFTQSQVLNVYIRVHTGERPFICEYCGKSYTQYITLFRHVRVHAKLNEKLFVCNYCNEKFSLKCSLITHIRVHTGEKPFECKSCGNRFSQGSTLTAHMKTHTGKKPFNCKLCGKRFTRITSSIRHMAVHTDEKPYECKSCGKRFRRIAHLTGHMRVHTGGKPFLCVSCGKRFRNTSNLTDHIRIHTGEKPFDCKSCGKRFRQRTTMVAHMRVHSVKPLKRKSWRKKISHSKSVHHQNSQELKQELS